MKYREEVTRALKRINTQTDLLHVALGLCEEAGEVAGIIKKHTVFDKPLDKESLLKELGDVRYYFEAILLLVDKDIKVVEKMNAKKLRLRFPNGYNDMDAINRRDLKGVL